MSDIEYSVSEHVATILLNRPARKNAFTMEMCDEWSQMLRTAEADPDVRVVVVTGAGGAFCSGVDLDVFGAGQITPLSTKEVLTKRIHQVAYAVEALSKPYLASVSGVAVGAGMDMALMADLRFAGESARFSEGYIRVGLIPGDGGCYFLPRIVGRATALRLMWTGDFVDAAESLQIGLVTGVHPDHDLDEAVSAFAARLVSQPPLAVQAIKSAVVSGERQDMRTALDLISSHMAVIRSTDDSREAMAAFTEKRLPTYRGH